jgi:hypothetical protein
MPSPLPAPIELFMSSENTHDLEALADCSRKYRHTVQPVAVSARDGKTVIRTQLTGEFPGSPITLDFVFTLEGGKIAALEIQS